MFKDAELKIWMTKKSLALGLLGTDRGVYSKRGCVMGAFLGIYMGKNRKRGLILSLGVFCLFYKIQKRKIAVAAIGVLARQKLGSAL